MWGSVGSCGAGLVLAVGVAGPGCSDEIPVTDALLAAFGARCIAPMMAGDVPELTGVPSPEDSSVLWSRYDSVVFEEPGEKIYGQSFTRNGYAGCTMVLAYHAYDGGERTDSQLAAFSEELLDNGYGARGACDIEMFTFQRILYSETRPLNGNHVVVLLGDASGFTPFLVAGVSAEGYQPPCEEDPA